jgi:hypothetical protein
MSANKLDSVSAGPTAGGHGTDFFTTEAFGSKLTYSTVEGSDPGVVRITSKNTKTGVEKSTLVLTMPMEFIYGTGTKTGT